MFPGTVTDRVDELEFEAALKEAEVGLWNESCFRIGSVLEMVALYRFDSKGLGPGFTLSVVASAG